MSTVEEVLKQRLEPGWSKEEFKKINYGDKRIDKRFRKVTDQLSASPTQSINQSCKVWADTKAAYRLFDNEKVTKEKILGSHQELTIERLKSHKTVLLLQDTTYLDFTKHKKKSGLGPIGTEDQDIRGIILHSTLAETETGLPLGLLNQEIWIRKEEEKGHREKRKELPIEEKESNKWLISLEKSEKMKPEGVSFVTVCDRESDVYDFFVKARELNSKVLVRAAQDRKLSGETCKLWEYMEGQEIKGRLEIEIPQKDKQKKRKAILSVRYATITLNPPQHLKASEKKKLGTITIDAVLAQEINAPSNVTPLEWMLLTNVAVKTFEDAVERLNWYKRRWDIEVYHKVIKSGCCVENCRLQTLNRLIPYIILCCIIAWRLLWMTKINREEPDAPCIAVLDEHEWKALYVNIHSTKVLPEKLPTVREVIRWIGQLGGFLARKGDKEPGITAIWRGWERLQDIAHMWLVMEYC
jgi:hypothetical protein